MPKRDLMSILQDPAIGGRIIMVLAVIGVLVIAILLSGPKPVEYDEEPTVSISSTQTSGDLQDTSSMNNEAVKTEYPVTAGVIVGAAAVLLIIEIGTFLELRQIS